MDMRKIFIVIIGLTLFITGCKSTVTNSVTFKSIALDNVIVNFMGETFTVAPNSSKTVRNIAKGTYEYSTTYVIPSGIKTSSELGAVNGPVAMSADTRITVMYSSSIQGTGDQLSYIIRATISSNDKVVTPTGP